MFFKLQLEVQNGNAIFMLIFFEFDFKVEENLGKFLRVLESSSNFSSILVENSNFVSSDFQAFDCLLRIR
jgi:hypothetical protein